MTDGPEPTGVKKGWIAAAKENLGRVLSTGVLELGLGATHFGIAMATHDPFYFQMGIAWTGLGAFEVGTNYLRKKRSRGQRNDLKGGPGG